MVIFNHDIYTHECLFVPGVSIGQLIMLAQLKLLLVISLNLLIRQSITDAGIYFIQMGPRFRSHLHPHDVLGGVIGVMHHDFVVFNKLCRFLCALQCACPKASWYNFTLVINNNLQRILVLR